jgi:hypothetical protein
VSSCDGFGVVCGLAECLDRVVVFAGLQAVVELAEEAVEQVPQGCGVAVTVLSSAAVVILWCARFGHGREGPEEPDDVEPVVFHGAADDGNAAPDALVTGAEPA